MNLRDMWHRITGRYERPEPLDYAPRMEAIDDELSAGLRELNELAARRRVFEISMGFGHENSQSN